MKTHRVSVARTLGLILLAATLCWAQQPVASVRILKEQIQQLETIDRDPATSDDVKILNRRFLNERRSNLRVVLRQRIETLRKYQTNVKSALTAEENKILEDSIAELEKTCKTLNETSRLLTLAPRAFSLQGRLFQRSQQPALRGIDLLALNRFRRCRVGRRLTPPLHKKCRPSPRGLAVGARIRTRMPRRS